MCSSDQQDQIDWYERMVKDAEAKNEGKVNSLIFYHIPLPEINAESFVKSFKRNVENHLESLRKSEYTKQVVVFLIEQESASLGVYEHDIFNRFYKLSEDKKMLQYIKETMTDVNYIIFNATDSYEIIDLSKIDLVITRAKENLDIRGGRQKNVSIKLYIDL